MDSEFVINQELVENMDYTDENETSGRSNLAEFLRHFPLSISILVKIFNESILNNSTPSVSGLLEKTSTVFKKKVIEQSHLTDNKFDRISTEKNVMPFSNDKFSSLINLKRRHTFSSSSLSTNLINKNKVELNDNQKNGFFLKQIVDSLCSPPLKRQFANVNTDKNVLIDQTLVLNHQEETKKDCILFKNPNVDESVNIKLKKIKNEDTMQIEESDIILDHSASPLTTAMIQILINEVRNVQRDQSLSPNRRRLLNPLVGVLNACIENGTRYAMNVLIEAMFENINSQKMIPLLDVLNSKL